MSYLHEEIFEQRQVLAGLIEAEWESIKSVAREVNRRGFQYMVIAARGSSDNAATKTYTTQLVALALLAVALAGDERRLTALKALPQAVGRTLALEGVVSAAVERYCYMETCVVIGRGYNYATTFEIALKLKELTYVVAEPYSLADFIHGPIAIVEEGLPVILVAPSGQVYDNMHQLGETLRERGAELVVISDRDEVPALAKTPLRLPVAVEEWLSPITSVIPGQLFAHYLALAKGYDPDHPRGLRKVTLTL